MDKLKDFNEVIHFYDFILNIMKKIKQRPNNAEKILRDEFSIDKVVNIGLVAPYRAMASNLSLIIAQIYEATKDTDDNQMLDELLGESKLLDKFTEKKQMTSSDKKRYIRNSLAHADYDFKSIPLEKVESACLKNETALYLDLQIEIDNEWIQGRIKFKDLEEFARIYMGLYAHKKHGFDISMLKVERDENKYSNVDEFIEKTKRIRISRKTDNSGIPFDKLKYNLSKGLKKQDKANIAHFLLQIAKGFRSFEVITEEIKPSGREFMKKYLEYVGLDNYMRNEHINQALSDLLAANNEKLLPIDTLYSVPDVIEDLRKWHQNALFDPINVLNPEFVNKMKGYIDKLLKFCYQAPMIYTSNLLGKTNYMIGYAREINAHEGEKYFDHFDIPNLEGITAYEEDRNGNRKEKKVQINPVQELRDKLQETQNTMEELKRERDEKDKVKRLMQRSRIIKTEQGESIEDINKWLEEYKKRKEKLGVKRSRLNHQISDGEERGLDKNNSFHFFRHIRNSLAHGTYEITYGDFNNLSDTKFCFRNIDPRTRNVYVVELTASQLENILEGFQQRVNECDQGYLNGKELEKQILKDALIDFGIVKEDIKEESVSINNDTVETGDKNDEKRV